MTTSATDGAVFEQERHDPIGLKDFDASVEAREQQIFQMQKELVAFRRQRPKEKIKDYDFVGFDDDKVRLSELFGDNAELMVIHNMGIACSHCTLWADGLNGVARHLESRAGFVVISPDPPRVQRALARSRGWTFKMVSAHGTSFFADLGFADESGQPNPGISTLAREPDGSIVRHQRTNFFPQDNFCVVWHMIELLPGAARDWQPVKPKGADIAHLADR
jgi:predicted dithiol-disulfide oxidoreductase (DUF899 family)